VKYMGGTRVGMSRRIENTILEAIGIIPPDGGELSALPSLVWRRCGTSRVPEAFPPRLEAD